MSEKRSIKRGRSSAGRAQSHANSSPPTGPKDFRSKPRSSLSPGLRWLLSGLLILQLLAVIAEPFRFFTRSSRGTSPAADPARNLLAPWVEFAYLNHGYFFFAPEPGPSHLIECNLKLEDGSRATLRFPDRNAQWPRLLYHRHFMMAENLHQLWAPPLTPQVSSQLDSQVLSEWQIDRQRFELVRDSMANHLAERYAAPQVSVERIEHRLPSDDEVLRQRMRLNDRRLYVTLPDAPLDSAAVDPMEPPPPETSTPAQQSVDGLPMPPPMEELP